MRNIRFRGVVCILTSAYTAGVALGQQPQTRPAAESSGAETIVRHLDNGLTVLCKRTGIAPVVCVQMVVKTGSIYEQEYLGAGISHLFEHLLHGGTTERRGEAEIRELMDRIGGNSNASTWKDWTRYFINTSSDNLDVAIDLLADFITRPKFPENEFKREWAVVQRELEMHTNDPARQLHYLSAETLYQVHPTRFPVIGYKPIVQTLTREDIIGYYKRMYKPDNVVVSIAGQMDPAAAIASVEKHFSDFARRPLVTISLPEEPLQVSPRRAVKYMQLKDAWVSLAYPTVNLTHPDLYPLDVLSYLLSAGQSSPLFRRVVLEEQAAYTISSSSDTPSYVRGAFEFDFRCDPAKVDKVLDLIRAEVDRVISQPIPDAQLERVKRQKIAEHVFAQERPESIAFAMAWSYLATGDPSFDEAYVEGIKRVKAEDVQRVARDYLVPERQNLMMILPESSRPASRPADKVSGVGDMKQFTLDNGLRVLARRNTQTPTVTMQLYFKGGLLADPLDKPGLANAAAMMAVRGTPTRSAQEIQSFFDGRGGSFRGSGGFNTISVSAHVLKEDFEAAAEIFADSALHAAFPADEWGKLLPRLQYQIRSVKDEWDGETREFFNEKFFEGGPYHAMPIGKEDALGQLTAEDLKAQYARLATGPNGVLAVFGDIDPDRAREVFARLLADLPAKPVENPAAAWPAPASIDKPIAYVAPSRHEATAGINVAFRGTTITDVKDRIPLMVLDTVMGGYGYPGGWLHNSLRGTGGRSLVYATHTINFYGLLPGYVSLMAGCEPDKVAQVCKIMLDLVEKARKGEITPDELETAKKIIVASEVLDNQTNSSLAIRAATNELYGLGTDFDEQLIETVKAMSVDEVKRVARKYLTTPIITVTAIDPAAIQLPVETVRVAANKGQ